MDSNQGRSAYQPNALALGQTGSPLCSPDHKALELLVLPKVQVLLIHHDVHTVFLGEQTVTGCFFTGAVSILGF